MKCPKCETEVDDRSEICPKCGYVITEKEVNDDSEDSSTKPSNIFYGITCIIGAALGIIGLVLLSSNIVAAISIFIGMAITCVAFYAVVVHFRNQESIIDLLTDIKSNTDSEE